MAKKILCIVDSAYRGTLEEQDDTTLWFTAACKGAGADLTVLLTGNAVNYTVMGQQAESLQFGKGGIPHPPKLDEDLKKLVGKGVPVFYVREDVEERGIASENMIGEAEAITRSQLAKFVEQYDHVWHW